LAGKNANFAETRSASSVHQYRRKDTELTKTTLAIGDDPLLAPKEAAPVLGLSVSWLAKARLRGDGPRFVKIGHAVRYPQSYLRDYIRSRTRSSTSET
jgi:predicted DNA-binding transcriptional regulator AlpA